MRVVFVPLLSLVTCDCRCHSLSLSLADERERLEVAGQGGQRGARGVFGKPNLEELSWGMRGFGWGCITFTGWLISALGWMILEMEMWHEMEIYVLCMLACKCPLFVMHAWVRFFPLQTTARCRVKT